MTTDSTQEYVPRTPVEETALAAFQSIPSHRRLYTDTVLTRVLGALREAGHLNDLQETVQ